MNTVTVNIRLPLLLNNRLIVAATELDVSVAHLIERAVEDFLEALDNPR